MLYSDKKPTVQYQTFEESDYMPYSHIGFSTLAVHAGQDPEPIHGSVNIPVHLTSTYAQKDMAELYSQFDYSRGGNPTRFALEECLSALQYGVAAVACSSGCGAVSTLLHSLKKGEHLLVEDNVSVTTQRYMKQFYSLQNGMDLSFVDGTNAENIAKAIKKETKMFWIESPSNPTLKVIDLAQIIQQVKKINPQILVVIDNTLTTPFLSSPLLLGADISILSLTMFVGGHSDISMGALVFKDKQIFKKVHFSAYSLGANPSPFDCYLALRSLKTLEVRMTTSTRNAYHIAHYLENHSFVESTFYPGLKSSKTYEIAKKQMRGFGGVVSFKIKGNKEQAFKFLKACKLFFLTDYIGGVSSSAQAPAFVDFSKLTQEERDKIGVTDNLIRLSVGNEDLDDLIQDIQQALQLSQQ